jgi:peptidyl-prolyl cis-trans isomerase SurA
MTLRISQFAVVCGLSVLALPGVVQAQAPRYQSPITLPGQVTPLPTPTAITPHGSVVEDVIVRVNDQIITRSDLERSEQQLAQEEQQSNATPAEAAERQKNLLRDMIDQQLLLSRGKELGINADAEVIRRLDEIRKQNHMDSMEDLEKAAQAQGVSFEDFKANIRNSVITQQVVRDEVGSRLQMSPIEERAYYEAHKQEFAQPEQVRLSEILIDTPADATDAQVAQARAKADDIAAKIKAGDKFEDLAKKYSGDATAAQGGDLGTYKSGALAKVLEDQTFGLPVGGVTAPIRTRQGFVILKVTDHQASGVPPLKTIEPQIQEAMYMQQMQPALRSYLTKLREDASIDVKDGFVDSGASSKQTKFVYTAYAPPVVKKKKEREKRRFERAGRYSKARSETKPVAVPVDVVTSTGTSTPTTSKTVKDEKPKKAKKIKREKVRFGQAPRNSLPAGPEVTGVGGDVGAGAASAAVTPGGTMAEGSEAAPGTAIAPVSSVSDTDADYNPLAPKAPERKKTRYSARAKTERAQKAKAKTVKAQEKAASAPTPMNSVEKATQQTQAAPLGLNGDTVKKKKKKKVKGAKKERLQNQAPKPAPPPPVETPSKAPDRGTPLEGTPGAAKPVPADGSNSPATAPAPSQN